MSYKNVEHLIKVEVLDGLTQINKTSMGSIIEESIRTLFYCFNFILQCINFNTIITNLDDDCFPSSDFNNASRYEMGNRNFFSWIEIYCWSPALPCEKVGVCSSGNLCLPYHVQILWIDCQIRSLLSEKQKICLQAQRILFWEYQRTTSW